MRYFALSPQQCHDDRRRAARNDDAEPDMITFISILLSDTSGETGVHAIAPAPMYWEKNQHYISLEVETTY